MHTINTHCQHALNTPSQPLNQHTLPTRPLERCKVRYERELVQLQAEKDQLEEQLSACREEVARLEARLTEQRQEQVHASTSSSSSSETLSAQRGEGSIATSRMSSDDQAAATAAMEVEPQADTEQNPTLPAQTPLESAESDEEEEEEEEEEQSEDVDPMVVDEVDDVASPAMSVDDDNRVVVTEENEEEGEPLAPHHQTAASSSSSSIAPPLPTATAEEGEGEPTSSLASSEGQDGAEQGFFAVNEHNPQYFPSNTFNISHPHKSHANYPNPINLPPYTNPTPIPMTLPPSLP